MNQPDPDSLDAAWAEAEAALPEGWTFGCQAWSSGRQCRAHASRYPVQTGVIVIESHSDTPAAALRALAAKLRGKA